MVKKSIAAERYQRATFKGIEYELQPLIIVTGSSSNTKLTFDLSAFDNAEGEYFIVDATSGKDVSSFTAKKGFNEVNFTPQKPGGDAVLGIIEVVDDIKNVDTEKIRDQYIQ